MKYLLLSALLLSTVFYAQAQDGPTSVAAAPAYHYCTMIVSEGTPFSSTHNLRLMYKKTSFEASVDPDIVALGKAVDAVKSLPEALGSVKEHGWEVCNITAVHPTGEPDETHYLLRRRAL